MSTQVSKVAFGVPLKSVLFNKKDTFCLESISLHEFVNTHFLHWNYIFLHGLLSLPSPEALTLVAISMVLTCTRSRPRPAHSILARSDLNVALVSWNL